jgi:pSer/pThr/pTyr-binding forkhead associated (FHA) protein
VLVVEAAFLKTWLPSLSLAQSAKAAASQLDSIMNSLPIKPEQSDLFDRREPPADFVPMRLAMQPAGSVFEFASPSILVGRHSSAELRLLLPDVSRKHCRFVHSAGSWQVSDLESTNGVFVNGEKVQQAFLRTGDLVKIGSYTFRVSIGHEAPSTDTGSSRSLPRIIGGPGTPTPPQRKAS